MEQALEEARRRIAVREEFSGFDLRKSEGALLLSRAGESFARLLPAGEKGRWRMEYCRQEQKWECIDFTGDLEECLEFLVANPHYLFWEG